MRPDSLLEERVEVCHPDIVYSKKFDSGFEIVGLRNVAFVSLPITTWGAPDVEKRMKLVVNVAPQGTSNIKKYWLYLSSKPVHLTPFSLTFTWFLSFAVTVLGWQHSTFSVTDAYNTFVLVLCQCWTCDQAPGMARYTKQTVLSPVLPLPTSQYYLEMP